MKICTVSESREQKYPHRKPSHAPRQPATTDSLGNWFQAGERRQMPPPTTHWEGIARASWFVGFLQDSHLAKCPIAQQSPLLFPRTAERVVGGSSSPTPGGRGGGAPQSHTPASAHLRLRGSHFKAREGELPRGARVLRRRPAPHRLHEAPNDAIPRQPLPGPDRIPWQEGKGVPHVPRAGTSHGW